MTCPMSQRRIFIESAGPAALARDSRQPADVVRQFEGQLRVLQAVVDEPYLASLTLRELLTERTLG